MGRQALGLGLKALIPDADEEISVSDVRKIKVDLITPNPYQPRREPDPEKLRDLVESIKEKGVVQPVLVRVNGSRYQLIAGERRFQAVKLAEFDEIPAIIREADDREMLELAIIENIQREDLNPIDEALAYKQLMDEFELTQEEAARRVGKERSSLANSVRLLKLAPSVQNKLSGRLITVGHARALLALDISSEQEKVCQRIVQKNLTVRETEKYIARLSQTNQPKALQSKKETHLQRTEEAMQRQLGTKVLIKKRGQKGQIMINFSSWDDLERIMSLIGVSTADI